MSKELEALKRIKEIELYEEFNYSDCYADDERADSYYDYDYVGTVEEKYKNEIKIIENALKALEIIKKCEIDMNAFFLGYYLNTYETFVELGIKHSWFSEIPTQEEYDLLKEVLL